MAFRGVPFFRDTPMFPTRGTYVWPTGARVNLTCLHPCPHTHISTSPRVSVAFCAYTMHTIDDPISDRSHAR